MSGKELPRVAVIIPCYNEAASIANVLEELASGAPEGVTLTLIAVNDASSDDTARIVRERGDGVVLLNLPVNLGIGGAVQAGFRYAEEHGFDFAVKFDGDGQHPADRIGDLLRPLMDGEADMTIGSRFLEGVSGFKSTPPRRLGIVFFQVLNSCLTARRVTDNTSGFRAYNRMALEFAARNYPSFDYPEPEEVVLMARNKFRLLEVPTPMRERSGGTSSISFSGSIYYMVKVVLAVLLTAFRPRIRRCDGGNK